jgi:hypothetical protein
VHRNVCFACIIECPRRPHDLMYTNFIFNDWNLTNNMCADFIFNDWNLTNNMCAASVHSVLYSNFH